MFAGILGTWDLISNVPQAIAVNDRSLACAVIINVCNRGGANALISIAISSNSTSPTDAEWIEWNTLLTPKNTLERQGIMVPAGKYVIVRSNQSSVNSVVYGVQNGDPITVAGITQNIGVPPAWVTSAALPTIYAGDPTTAIQLSASDVEGQPITYTLTSGSLSGMTLSTDGLISGTPSVTGYYSGIPDDTSVTATITATDSTNLSTARVFNITRRWRDGTSSGQAAVNAESIKAMTGTSTNGQYWIQPLGAPSAQQVFCIMDNSIGDSGGWMSAFNILSTTNSGIPGGAADWYNTQFWDDQNGTFNTGSTLTANFKNNVYGYAPAKKVNFLLHNVSATSFRGYGYYTLTSGIAGNSLYQLCSGGTNTNVLIDNRIASGSRTAGSATGASGCVRNTLRPQSEYGDLFIDGQNAGSKLVFRQRDPWESTGGYVYNSVRIATTLGDGNSTYGHTFAGIGGTHENSGWKADFALAPVSPYCDNPQSYGDRSTGVNLTEITGWSYPYSTTCTTNTNGQLNVGYGVFIK